MNKDYSGVEKRKYKRVLVNFNLRYRIQEPLRFIMLIGDKEVNAVMIDLSEGGMAIVTNYSVPVGTELALKFTLVYPRDQERSDDIVVVLGRVTYCTPMDKANRIGISFTRISKQQVSTIVEFVNLVYKPPQ